MKSVRDIKEIIDHGEKINLENVVIGEKEYSLEVTNPNGMLIMSFNKGDYEIKIRDGSLTFERHLYRPNHDHDDAESLQIAIDSGPGRTKGEIAWRTRFPHPQEGYDFYRVSFGPETRKGL